MANIPTCLCDSAGTPIRPETGAESPLAEPLEPVSIGGAGSLTPLVLNPIGQNGSTRVPSYASTIGTKTSTLSSSTLSSSTLPTFNRYSPTSTNRSTRQAVNLTGDQDSVTIVPPSRRFPEAPTSVITPPVNARYYGLVQPPRSLETKSSSIAPTDSVDYGRTNYGSINPTWTPFESKGRISGLPQTDTVPTVTANKSVNYGPISRTPYPSSVRSSYRPTEITRQPTMVALVPTPVPTPNRYETTRIPQNGKALPPYRPASPRTVDLLTDDDQVEVGMLCQKLKTLNKTCNTALLRSSILTWKSVETFDQYRQLALLFSQDQAYLPDIDGLYSESDKFTGLSPELYANLTNRGLLVTSYTNAGPSVLTGYAPLDVVRPLAERLNTTEGFIAFTVKYQGRMELPIITPKSLSVIPSLRLTTVNEYMIAHNYAYLVLIDSTSQNRLASVVASILG